MVRDFNVANDNGIVAFDLHKVHPASGYTSRDKDSRCGHSQEHLLMVVVVSGVALQGGELDTNFESNVAQVYLLGILLRDFIFPFAGYSVPDFGTQ